MVEHIKCCGMEMKKRADTLLFEEYECSKCGDVVYVRKKAAAKPQMIDD